MTGPTTPPPPASGQAYLVLPPGGRGPGLLALHSWWGLTDSFKRWCNQFADAGYVVLAPDLLGGARPATAEDAQELLAATDTNRSADLVLSSAATLRLMEQTPDAPVGVVGLSMGASWGLWLASRAPEQVAALAFFYGSQQIDRLDITAPVLGHLAEHDDLIDADERVLLEAALMLGDNPAEVHHYPGTHHWFMESDRPEHDPTASATALARTLSFLGTHLESTTP